MGRSRRPEVGGNSMIKIPLKGLISVPKIQINGPINDSLVSYLLEIIFGELLPLMFYDTSIRSLISLLYLLGKSST